MKKTRAPIVSPISVHHGNGGGGEETIAEAAETDVDAYIIKPFVAKNLGRRRIETGLEPEKESLPLDTPFSLGGVFAHAGQYNKATSELKPPWLRNQ